MKYKITFLNESDCQGIKLNSLRGSEKQKAWANSLRQNVINNFCGSVDDNILSYFLNEFSSASDIINMRNRFTDFASYEKWWNSTFEYCKNAVRINELAKTKAIKVFIPKELYSYEDESRSVIVKNGKLLYINFNSPINFRINGDVSMHYQGSPLVVNKGDKIALAINETSAGTDDYKVTDDGVYVTIRCSKGFTPSLINHNRYNYADLNVKYEPKWNQTNVKTWGIIVDYLKSL